MALVRLASRVRFAAVVLAAFAAMSLAQTAPPPANMPRPACSKPGEFPGRLASDRQIRAWQNELKAYGECVKKFADDQKAISELAIKAGNAAVEEYNAIVKAATDEMK
jgi:hypothetical protein